MLNPERMPEKSKTTNLIFAKQYRQLSHAARSEVESIQESTPSISIKSEIGIPTDSNASQRSEEEFSRTTRTGTVYWDKKAEWNNKVANSMLRFVKH